jgi:hypothetical protein
MSSVAPTPHASMSGVCASTSRGRKVAPYCSNIAVDCAQFALAARRKGVILNSFSELLSAP